MKRHKFPVTVKAAIFNSDYSKILLIDTRHDGSMYGLPGGHIEKGESIEVAIQRELYEECGIKDVAFRKADFFFHNDGKLVLAFVGSVQQEAAASTQRISEGLPVWATKDFLLQVSIEPHYRAFVLKQWDQHLRI